MAEESTTSDRVEMTRRILQALSGADVDAVLSFYAPDAVSEPMGMGRSFEGAAALRGFYGDWFRAYEEFEVRLAEVLDPGSGVVFDVNASLLSGGR